MWRPIIIMTQILSFPAFSNITTQLQDTFYFILFCFLEIANLTLKFIWRWREKGLAEVPLKTGETVWGLRIFIPGWRLTSVTSELRRLRQGDHCVFGLWFKECKANLLLFSFENLVDLGLFPITLTALKQRKQQKLMY